MFDQLLLYLYQEKHVERVGGVACQGYTGSTSSAQGKWEEQWRQLGHWPESYLNFKSYKLVR